MKMLASHKDSKRHLVCEEFHKYEECFLKFLNYETRIDFRFKARVLNLMS